MVLERWGHPPEMGMEAAGGDMMKRFCSIEIRVCFFSLSQADVETSGKVEIPPCLERQVPGRRLNMLFFNHMLGLFFSDMNTLQKIVFLDTYMYFLSVIRRDCPHRSSLCFVIF